MDKSIDAYTGFGITVLFKLLTGFLGRAATGDRSSVAYRTPAKISHRPYLKLSHRKHFSHALIHTCYSVWPHRCCGSACTSPCTWCHNCNWRAMVINGKTKGLRTPPPRWVSAHFKFEAAHNSTHVGVVRIF